MAVELNLGIPNEKQERALLDRHKYLCFGGARGGGKSWFVRSKSISGAYVYPGTKIIIARKTYPELINNHINALRELLRCDNKTNRLAKYNSTDKELIFPNGSRIKFMHCENSKALGKWQGNECDWLFIDEATQFTEDEFKKMSACVRGVNNIPKRVYLTCNPDNVGLAWVKRLFIDRNFKSNEDPEEYAFIQSLVQDNKALMESNPDYIKNLEALPKAIREAWLNGKWDAYIGQFFEEFTDNPEGYITRTYTHVIEPFDIPLGWKIYRSFDWGYSRPFSVGWWALDYDDCLYRIYEWYGCTGEANEGLKMTPDEVFKKIYDLEHTLPLLKGRKIYGVADPAIWSKGTGYSINDFAMHNGVYFEKGDNNRIQGWLQCHYRMAFDENGKPLMYVFNTCKDFIRTIPLQMYDEKHPEDCDTSLEDHIADEFRYMCMMRTVAPRKHIQPAVKADNPLDL